MPIYAYRCDACGHAKDVLQKVSDPVLTVCPACGADQFRKQVTAAGFQLKGSGWYVTDFRGGDSKKPAAKPDGEGTGSAAPAAEATKTEAKAEAKSDSSGSSSTTASAPAPSTTPTSGSSQ